MTACLSSVCTVWPHRKALEKDEDKPKGKMPLTILNEETSSKKQKTCAAWKPQIGSGKMGQNWPLGLFYQPEYIKKKSASIRSQKCDTLGYSVSSSVTASAKAPRQERAWYT